MNGIPALLAKVAPINRAIATVELLIADAIGIASLFAGPQWGIFKDSELFLYADSVVEFYYRGDSKISTYPQEEGNFAAYNKVQIPADIRIKVVKGGYDYERENFLTVIDALKKSTGLYSFVMPEKSYDNINIIHYDFKRTSKNGVHLLMVEIWGNEVVLTAEQETINAKESAGKDRIDGGVVTPQKPTMEAWSIDNPGIRKIG